LPTPSSCHLPESYLAQMRKQLGADFPAFLAAYDEEPWRGLRLNLLKLKFFEGGLGLGETFFQKSFPQGFNAFTPVPHCPEALAYRTDLKPGQTLLYLAGLFYIQEPSAMYPAALLDAQPGQRVLDLCAAPGGKTTQIAGAMQGQGLLVANDASPARAQALVRNMERAGVRNAVVLTEQAHRLAARFPAFFDRVLVDAPCSGEGMFRRDAAVLKAYTHNKPEACAAIQGDILRRAAETLKPGGKLVYSTCTFNTLENEAVVEGFLAGRGDFSLEEIKRVWPHRDMGEGHFVAVMKREGPTDAHSPAQQPGAKYPAEFTDFCRAFLHTLPPGFPVLHGDNVYLQPQPVDLRGLRVARSGWHVGGISKGRFTPSQGLAMALRAGEARYALDLPEACAWRYVKGESLEHEDAPAGKLPAKPWLLICHEGHPLGWARQVQGRLKNHLPTGWVRG